MNEKQSAIENKLQKAKAFLGEVDILIEHGFYLTAINRLYYACFHATKALLLTKDIVPKTHSGVVNQLHLHFVQNDKFLASEAAFFSRLMQERIHDDYSDALIIEREIVEDFILPARAYVEYIETLIVNS